MDDVIRRRITSLEDSGLVVLNLDHFEDHGVWLCGCACLTGEGEVRPTLMVLSMDTCRRSASFRGLNQNFITPEIWRVMGESLEITSRKIEYYGEDLVHFIEKIAPEVHVAERDDGLGESDSAHDFAPPSYN